MNDKQKILFKKGRGAQIPLNNRFHTRSYLDDPEHKEHLFKSGLEVSERQDTAYIKVHPKSILNKVASPDIGHNWSMNPYQGCEHGCAYCYARTTHDFWGYNSGVDFEQKIMVKENAPLLLEKALQKNSWLAEPIMLSGNTDCYQPIERKLKITRRLLEVCLKYRQPVGIISKNTLVLRDMDILKELQKFGLVQVVFSITSLDEHLRAILEPRTATTKKKLKAIKSFADENIPVGVMMAPIIPGLNSHEILNIAKAASEYGALAMNYTMLRLNGVIGEIFLDWLDHHFPDRADKIKHLVQQTHGGKLSDSRIGTRMRGEGAVAEQINSLIKLAKSKYFGKNKMPTYNKEAFVRAPKGQLELFRS